MNATPLSGLSAERKLNLAFAGLILLLVAMAVAASIAVRSFNEASARVLHTEKVLRNLEQAWASLQDMRINSRDYMLSGDPRFLVPMEQGMAGIYQQVEVLAELTRDNPLQQQRIVALRPLLERKISDIRRTVAYGSNPASTAEMGAMIRRQKQNDPLRELLTDISTTEAALMVERLDSARTRAHWTVVALAAGLTLDFLLLGAVYGMARRHRQAQEKIIRQETEARLFSDSIVDTVREPLVILREDLRVAQANRAYYALFGASRENTELQPIEKIGGGVWQAAALTDALRGVVAEGAVVNDHEITHDFPSLGRRTFLLSARRLLRPGRHRERVLVAMEDITERKRLDQIHLQFRALFESLPGLYLVLRPDFTIVAASEAYLQATLTRRADIMGRNLFEVFTDDTNDATADGVENLRRSLERVRTSRAPDTMAIQKYSVRRPDGLFEERHWSPVNSPVLGADGAIEYFIHRVEDVTDYIRSRQAAGARRDETTPRLMQMEAEIFLSAQKVQAINQQLETANKELEAFSYSVSHDLRAPLRHIDGYAQLLLKTDETRLSERGRSHLAQIIDSARQMGLLIDDLLMFSRMARTEMRKGEVDLHQLAAEIVQRSDAEVGDRVVHWHLTPMPTVVGDRAMLKQVLVNLLGNALKYTRPRAEAEISLLRLPDTSTEAVMAVRDNGVGFDMQYGHKLFGVFQRLHHADEFEGTGIGLASVRRIISRHGGRTWAEGELDRGATFYFTLPKPRPDHEKS